MFRRVAIISWLLCQFIHGFSQVEEEVDYAQELLALEQELDSLSIFNLIDSILLLESPVKSEMNLRFGVTTSVTSAGRDYNIDQTGYSTGLSYFHKSGVYGDLSGYWNSNVNPTYNPTILSAGYLGSFSNKWSYSLDYEHWFYNPKDSSDNPLTNSFGTSASYDFGLGYASVDYSYLFGKETASRIIGNLTGTINLGKWWMFNNVTIFPSASIMAGNGDITTLTITTQQISNQDRLTIERINTIANLTEEEKEKLRRFIRDSFFRGDVSGDRALFLLSLIETAENLTPEELAELNAIAENGIEQQEFVDGNEFGILNYSFTLPISLSSDRISLILSYTYSIPVKLPGEFFDVDPLGYFAASLSFRLAK